MVTANVAGADLAGTVGRAQAAVDAGVDLPSGYFVTFGGQFEEAGRRISTVALLVVLILIAMYGLLYIEFGSHRETLIMLVNVPLALVGGVLAVALGDGVLSLATVIGFVTLFGIATRNGVLLVSNYRRLLGEGLPLDEAVRRGSGERMAPILMTALTAGLALVPLVLAAGAPGNEILSPMAQVILGGLLTSTFLKPAGRAGAVCGWPSPLAGDTGLTAVAVAPELYLRHESGCAGQAGQPPTSPGFGLFFGSASSNSVTLWRRSWVRLHGQIVGDFALRDLPSCRLEHLLGPRVRVVEEPPHMALERAEVCGHFGDVIEGQFDLLSKILVGLDQRFANASDAAWFQAVRQKSVLFDEDDSAATKLDTGVVVGALDRNLYLEDEGVGGAQNRLIRHGILLLPW